MIGIDAAIQNGDLHSAAIGAHSQQGAEPVEIERLIHRQAVTDAAHVDLDLADVASACELSKCCLVHLQGQRGD
ncbi:MAG: hypothetical protein IPO08_16800 [Xanthomonadales bacterium]|nr:hypothetical protein [Xanthomonadales bacterium]